MTIEVQHISASASGQSGYWRVVRDGKTIEMFFTDTAEADARAYAANLADSIAITEVQDVYGTITQHPLTEEEEEVKNLRNEVAELRAHNEDDKWGEQIGRLLAEINRIESLPPFWTCAVYLVDKAYGGPEEGGWYYTCGERQDQAIDELPPSLLAFTIHKEDAALRFAEIVQSHLDRGVNKNRRDISSVLSTGKYYAEVHRGYPPKRYPEETPHYE